jgi:hypothetical protein
VGADVGPRKEKRLLPEPLVRPLLEEPLVVAFHNVVVETKIRAARLGQLENPE